jgi:hypothetical protein
LARTFRPQNLQALLQKLELIYQEVNDQVYRGLYGSAGPGTISEKMIRRLTRPQLQVHPSDYGFLSAPSMKDCSNTNCVHCDCMWTTCSAWCYSFDSDYTELWCKQLHDQSISLQDFNRWILMTDEDWLLDPYLLWIYCSSFVSDA